MQVKYKGEPATVLDIKRDQYSHCWAYLEFYGSVYRAIRIEDENLRATDRRALMQEDIKRHSGHS